MFNFDILAGLYPRLPKIRSIVTDMNHNDHTVALLLMDRNMSVLKNNLFPVQFPSGLSLL